MTIKIDVDGVIRDLLRAMCEVFNDEFDSNVMPRDIKEYKVNDEPHFRKIRDKYPSITPHEYFFRENARKVFLDYAYQIFGAKQAIDKLRKNGHKVVIVTKQIGIKNKVYTLEFLNKNRIEYDDICFTADKWAIDGDYLIDDNPEFLEDEREKSKKIIIDAPYNQNSCKELPRFHHLFGAVDFILGDTTYDISYLFNDKFLEFDPKENINTHSDVPICCKNCPNYKPNQLNICNCVQPYMSGGMWEVTCSVNTYNNDFYKRMFENAGKPTVKS